LIKEVSLKATETLLRLIFPPKCIFCGKILDIEKELEICDDCFEKLDFIKSPIIMNNVIACVCQYNAVLRGAIVKYKFFDKPSFYRAFGLLLSQRVQEVFKDIKIDLLVSVPLHKKRERERGYNQAKLIAQQVSRHTGIPDRSKVIARVVNTKPQSLLSKEERKYNLEAAFIIEKPKEVQSRTILLIDDVLTTGATLHHCSECLKQAGAKAVFGAVIGTGRNM
jgi:ComF family protein